MKTLSQLIQDTLPKYIKQRTIHIKEFNERMSNVHIKLNKKETFELVKDMQKNGIAKYQPTTGRLIFQR